MHRFSTPEEVFGPVSITKLRKDKFLRKTKGFLPQSDFAFLDEIWKSSPAILNTLLTIINEKRFRNGTQVESTPLKVLIAASNETPPPGQGLEALYDRFLVRSNVPPMEVKDSFEALLRSQPTSAELELPDGLTIKHEEWKKWCNDIHSIKLSEETLNIIHDIRRSFEEKGEELDVYVSDRCWQKAAILLKAAAFFCDREETNLVDTLLLRHCLWTTKDNYEEVLKIVEAAVRNFGFETDFRPADVDYKKDKLENEITKELHHSADVYETKTIRGTECFKCFRQYSPSYHSTQREVTFYIPTSKIKSNDEFYPIDEQGNELEHITCCFRGLGTCSIIIDDSRYGHVDLKDFSPRVLFYKESKKINVNPRLIKSLKEAVQELIHQIEEIIEQIEAKFEQFKTELETPFVPESIQNIALEGVEEQLRDMKARRKDCDRIERSIG